MTRAQATVWSTFSALIGGAIVVYLLLAVPPTSTTGALDIPALVLFLIGYTSLWFGLGGLVALALHRRWPALAGASGSQGLQTSAALRQGLLFAVGMVVLAILALTGIFDVAFVLITIVLIGLIEAFIQNRQ